MVLLNESYNFFACTVPDQSVIYFPPVDSPGWRISVAVLLLLLTLFHLFTVLYLSLLLKKRAWDSPAKRFGHSFNLYFAMTFLFFAIVFLSASSITFLNFALTIVRYPVVVAFLNFTASLVALSLQLVAPFLPERVKKQCESRPHCVMYTEVIIHVLFLLLIILSVTFSLVFKSCIFYSHILLLIVVCFSNIISFLSLAMLVFTYIKFFKNPNINRSIKYVILKLVFVIIICTILLIVVNTYFMFLYLLSFFFLTLSVLSLNSPLHIWCYVCYLRRSQESRVPLLPINDTEGQQTNPLSVWDHSNVPSYTETNLPFEMSDGRSRSDCISFSVLTPSVHYR